MKKILCLLFVIFLAGCASTTKEIKPTETKKENKVVIADMVNDENQDKVLEVSEEEVLYKDVKENENFVKIDNFYGDGAIYQRNVINKVFGTCSYASMVYLFIQGKYFKGTVENNTWYCYLPFLEVGGPYELSVISDVGKLVIDIYVGDIYMCAGQSNMEWTMNGSNSVEEIKNMLDNADNEYVRVMKLEPYFVDTVQDTIFGNYVWKKSTKESLAAFSCCGFLFGQEMYQKTNIPIGLVSTAIGGTSLTFWQSTEGMEKLSQMGITPFTDRSQAIYTPSIGYNGMIAPLTKYQFRGVLWYQGESNTASYAQYGHYQEELEVMINDWRTSFHNDKLFFVLYEIARLQGNEEGFGQIRYQLNQVAESDPYACFVVNHDEGLYTEPHPRNKIPVSHRACDSVLSSFYGFDKTITYMEYKSYEKISDNQIKIYFDGVKEITYLNKLMGMEVSNDGEYYETVTDFEEGKDYLIVNSTSEIKYIRYGFRANPVGEMFTNSKLHASLYNEKGNPLKLFYVEIK